MEGAKDFYPQMYRRSRVKLREFFERGVNDDELSLRPPSFRKRMNRALEVPSSGNGAIPVSPFPYIAKPPNEGSCNQISGTKKPPFREAESVDTKTCGGKAPALYHLPIARRSNGDFPAGSSPDSASSLLQPSRFPSDIFGFARPYSGGTVPVFHRTSLLSPCGHLLLFLCDPIIAPGNLRVNSILKNFLKKN